MLCFLFLFPLHVLLLILFDSLSHLFGFLHHLARMNPILDDFLVFQSDIFCKRVLIRELSFFIDIECVCVPVEAALLLEVEPLHDVDASLVDVVAGEEVAECEAEKGRERIVEDVLWLECRYSLGCIVCLDHRHLHSTVAVRHESQSQRAEEGESVVGAFGPLEVLLFQLSDRPE